MRQPLAHMKNNFRKSRQSKSPHQPVQHKPVQNKPAAKLGPLNIPKHLRVIIGTHAILEALAVRPHSVEELWLEQGWQTSQDLKKIHAENKSKTAKIEEKSSAVLERLATSHQGAALLVNETPEVDWDLLNSKADAKVVLLDGIEDPHNLGAIMRTSWLMGVDAILIPADRAVKLTPIVHKVASGGAEHVPVEICQNFTNYLEDLKKNDFWVYGLSHLGKGTLFDLKISQKVVRCVGAEDKGLRTTTERLCDELVRIPQVSAAASYNASVATSMALLETHRQGLKKNFI